MIGSAPFLSALLSVALCLGLLPGGSEGPGPAIAADRLVADRAQEASAALEALDDALEPAVEAGRRGAARIVTGDEPPSQQFAGAAAAVSRAEDAARVAVRAVAALDAALVARDPDAEPIGPPVVAGDLASIAGQLDATGSAGDAFTELRRDAQRVTESLDSALSALDEGDLDAAAVAVDDARRAHASVAAWEEPPGALPVWIETTAAMIGAMDTIVTATRAGDAEAAMNAADEFAALGEEGASADRALRIAVSEGGNALAATALGRLAAVLDSVASARARVAAVAAGVGS